MRGLPETTSTKRLASTWPISSRPMSLLPSAAACASSPSTISSGSGGAEPICQIAAPSPIASTSSGSEEERQALVAADVLMGAGIFVAGMADQHRSRHQFAELAAAVQAETALADIGDRVAAMLLPRTACRRVPRVQRKSDTEMDLRSQQRGRGHAVKFRYARAAAQPAAARRTGSCWRSGGRPRSTAAGAWRWRRRSARSCRHSARPRARDGRAR